MTPGAALSVLAAAREAPGRLAAVTEHGASLTFAQLAREVAGAARHLSELPGAPSEPVAVVAERRLSTAVAIFALAELGVPAVLLHPRLRPSEREELLARAFPGLHASRILGPGAAPPQTTATPASTSSTSCALGAATNPEPPPADDRPLIYAFTSGSRGAPKAVELSRRAVAASVAASAAHLGWRPDDRWQVFLPLAHVGGLSILFRCLAARRAFVLEPEGRFTAAKILASMRARRVTLASAVPAMLRDLVDAGGSPPPRLRALLLGGAPAPPSLLREAARAGFPVLTTYGMTETASQIATWPASEPLDPRRGAGALLPGVEVDIRDGRIFIRGEMLMTRYVPTEGERSPIGADGFFDTGDRGELSPGGFLRPLGRTDDTIITGGENVDPADVEAALCRAPSVASAIATGIPDPRRGEVVAAAVVARPGTGSAAAVRAEVTALARRHLAAFKRPAKLEIWPNLPLTPSGKPDRRAARARLENAPPAARADFER